jgi:hypothetical protein
MNIQPRLGAVGCSSFKPTPYGMTATNEHLQYKLGLMGTDPPKLILVKLVL